MIALLPLLTALTTSPCAGVLTGVDRLSEAPYRQWLEGKKIGLITNHTGVNCRLEPTAKVVAALRGAKLIALFAPEHGIRGRSQAEEKIQSSGIIYSLYGETRAPTPEMLSQVEVLVFDLQDVGARFYTYISTMLESMRAAAREEIPFVVLDRPNPITGTRVEGPILEKGFESFVGSFSLPIRYGLTPGELAGLLDSELQLQCHLKVVPLQGWRREFWYDETRLIWISPSPNISTLDTATLYPGFCLIEGTNLSEGRGTTRPFELVGAPWLDNERLVEGLNALRLPGVAFRIQDFEPWFSKYRGEACHGVQIHVLDRVAFRPLEAILHFLAGVIRLHPDEFRFQPFFDSLAGNSWIRQELKRGTGAAEIQSGWEAQLHRFRSLRGRFLLYSKNDVNSQP